MTKSAASGNIRSFAAAMARMIGADSEGSSGNGDGRARQEVMKRRTVAIIGMVGELIIISYIVNSPTCL